MAKYIDAEKLKGLLLLDQNGIKDSLKHGTHLHPIRKLEHKAYIDAIEYCVKQINEAPAADVAEVKHGEWIEPTGKLKRFEGRYVICSHCNVMLPIIIELGEYYYCPNCGAKMDGRSDT